MLHHLLQQTEGKLDPLQFERIMLHHLLQQTEGKLDPPQFAYKRNKGVEDAILLFLHDAYTHLDKVGSFVRILFVDYSSAFNTIQPHLLTEKLFSLNVGPTLILWLIDFLVNRSLVVRYKNVLSHVKTTSTGAPQGTVLSPVFFNIYTDDFRSSSSICSLNKYSDNSALADLSNSDSHFEQQVTEVTRWCKDNYLYLNVEKTREMVVDSRRYGCVGELVIEGVIVK